MRKRLGTILLLLLAHAGVVAGTQAIVKNVQRGSTDMGVNPRDVTITAVDTTKAYVIGSSRTNTSDPRCRVTFELINATTVRITSNLVNAATEVEWEVVEFASDVVIKRNVTTFNALTQNVALAPAVVVNKSFVLISERYGSSNTNQDERWTIRARLTAGNNLELARNETGTDVTVAWQVIEFTDTSTTSQHGIVSITAGNTFVDVPVPPVDLTRSFLQLTRRGSAATNGVEGEFMVWGQFLNATTLRFTRGSVNNSVDVAWTVVTLGPEAAVDSGTVTFPVGSLQQDVSIAAVNPAVTMTYVCIAGGGADVNKLDDDSVSSQLAAPTILRFQRKDDRTQIDGVWFVVQFSWSSLYRETADLDGDGHIDAIRMLAFEPVNDDFTGLTVTVTGYTVTGYSTGATANDNEFYVLLQELAAYDTGALPASQMTTNTTLTGLTSGRLVRTEPSLRIPVDAAKPVLVQAEWFDGSGGGVTATDTVILTFSETVTAAGMLIGDLGLPVTGDTFDTTFIPDQGPASTITFTLFGTPLLTPGGTYAAGALTPGSPTGVFTADGSHVTDAVGLTAVNQGFGTAVDLLPGEAWVRLTWDDLSITPKTWALGPEDLGMTRQTDTDAPPLSLIAHNSSNVRVDISVSCTATSAPSGWTLAAAAGTDAFEMKLVDGALVQDLAAGAKSLTAAMYSGFEKPFDLRMVMPTEVNSGLGTQQTITVTLTASQN